MCYERISFKIERLVYYHETEFVYETSDLKKAMEICKSIDGDYNVIVFKNGKFVDLFMDMEAKEFERFC